MDAKFRKDAIFNGMTSNAFKVGTVLSLGWFWARIGGCCVLYRGDSIWRVDLEGVIAVANKDAGQIEVPVSVRQEKGTSYYYVLRWINCLGEEEKSFSAVGRVAIDDSGEVAEPRPNELLWLQARCVDSGQVELLWFYNPVCQETEPDYFGLYWDGGTGWIDYDDAIGTVAYAGRRFYRYLAGPFEQGEYIFGVRAETGGGAGSKRGSEVMIQLDGANPDSVSIITAESM